MKIQKLQMTRYGSASCASSAYVLLQKLFYPQPPITAAARFRKVPL